MGKCQLGNNTSNIDDNRQQFYIFALHTLHAHTYINLIYNVETRNTLCLIKYCGVWSYFIESWKYVVSQHQPHNTKYKSSNKDTREQELLSSQKMMILLFNLPKIPNTKVNWLSFLLQLFIDRCIDRVLGAQFHDKWNRSMESQISYRQNREKKCSNIEPKHLAAPNEQQIVQEINYHSFAQMHNNEWWQMKQLRFMLKILWTI